MTTVMKTELVTFYASDGLELQGLLFRCGKRTNNVIINVFGMTDDFFSHKIYRVLAKEIRKINADLFVANNRGMQSISHFKRKGTKKLIWIGTAKEKFEDCIHDIKGAISAMRKLGYKNIMLQGHSTGCQKITYYKYKTNDSFVKALVLLAPADDYNIARRKLGKKFSKAVKIAEQMIRQGKGDELTPKWISYYTAKRFLSYADPKNIEAQMFNYDSDLRLLSKIKCPILAIFGSKEEHAVKPVITCLKILQSKTSSKNFNWKIISGADHGFHGKENMLSNAIVKWLEGVVL